MKILFDEDAPRPFRSHLPGHEITTVPEMGWAGVKNGALLDLAEGHGFEVLVTFDQNLQYQQNLIDKSDKNCVLVDMRTRSFRLTEEQAAELQAAFIHCQDAHTKTRYQAVRLYGLGHPVAQVTDICACSTRSLLHWRRAYQEGGLSALVDHRQGGNRAKLKPEQIEHLMNQLHQYTPAQLLGPEACVGEGQFWSVPEVACLLERDYGLTYQSATSYRTLLQKCELSYQRPAKVYKSRSEAKVMAFEEQLEKKAGRYRPRRA